MNFPDNLYIILQVSGALHVTVLAKRDSIELGKSKAPNLQPSQEARASHRKTLDLTNFMPCLHRTQPQLCTGTDIYHIETNYTRKQVGRGIFKPHEAR